jgi:predicted RNA methylase
MSKAKELDQYYTREDVAIECLNLIPERFKTSKYTWIEPTCGTGAFFNNFPSKTTNIALDIDPKIPNATQQDFLTYTNSSENVVVVTSPPFGVEGQLAIDFLKHATTFADVVCVLIPLVFKNKDYEFEFRKQWMKIVCKDLEPNIFIHEGKPFSFPCVFQVWEKVELKDRRMNYLNESYKI